MSPIGLALVKEFEGCRLHAYRDIVGVPTIGYGHTEGVAMDDVITQEQADEMLLAELDKFGMRVLNLCTNPPNTNQADAMTCLAYNIGLGGFAGSTVLRRHNQKLYTDAGMGFLLWNKAGGVVVTGLVRRRSAERDLYLRPVE